MCGILGAYSNNLKCIDPDFIRRLNLASQRMEYRGPDDAGEFISSNKSAALYHRRLSIIDLSPAGHQPMSAQNERYWITYNGEIYNYKEIRDELLKKGYHFQSQSDTEVILNGYIEYGVKVLDRLRGIFAFGIYDQKTHRLFVARDRIGVKPLYFSNFDNNFIFSSSLHALIKVTGTKPELDHQNVYEYLYLGMVQAPNTVFKGYYKLPPGHFISFEEGKQNPKPVQYWDVDHGSNIIIPDTEEEIIEQLDGLIVDAVKSRLVSDVPVSVFLSGGLDSGLIAAIASKNYTGRMKSFSLGFKDDAAYNELDEARETAKWLGTEHHEIMIGKEDVQNFMPKFVKYQEEPSLNPIQMMIYFLSKMVHESGTKVVLSGDGGDELFFGYNEWTRYLNFYKRYYSSYIKSPGWMRKSIYHLSKPILPIKPRYDILRRAAYNETFYHGWGAFKLNELEHILHPDFLSQVRSPYNTIHLLEKRFDELKMKNKSYSDWMRYVSLKTYLVEDYMNRVDNMAMANSVEGRVPFLDQHLVEYSFMLPEKFYLKEGHKKYLLKKVAERHIPHEMIYRKKRGFTAPITKWMDSHHKIAGNDDHLRILEDYFTSSFLKNFNSHFNYKNVNSSAFWNVISLTNWLIQLE